MEDKGMNTKLNEIYERVVPIEKDKKKKKKFKLPSRAKLNRTKLKKNWATLIVLRNNGIIMFDRGQIINGAYLFEGAYRIASSEFIWSDGKHPYSIIPEDSFRPISIDDLQRGKKLEKVIELKNVAITAKKADELAQTNEHPSSAEKFLIRSVNMDLIKPKGAGLNVKAIVMVVILIIIAYGVISGFTGG